MNNKVSNRKNSSNKNDVNGLENIERLFSGLKVPAGRPKEFVWQSILEKIDEKREVRIISFSYALVRIAASIIVLAVLGSTIWIWGFSNVDIYSPRGRQMTILLPDNSKVTLNADTRISYNKVLWNFSRKVNLQGEARFKVKKGEQFDVVTDLAVTSVLGTTFDVYYRNGEVKVKCIEGKVAVEPTKAQNGNTVYLTAGLETKTHGKNMEKVIETSIESKPTWVEGEFYFNNSPVGDVFEELERQFDIDIFYEGDPDRFYTGYFSNKDLNLALGLVCIPMDFTHKVNGKVVIIQSKK